MWCCFILKQCHCYNGIRLVTCISITNDNEIKDRVCNFDNLNKRMMKCKQGVMWKASVASRVIDGIFTIHKLRKSLVEGTYKIGKYGHFTIYEPKKRNIISTQFVDRIFQSSLVKNYLYETLTRSFIRDNVACQIDKGTDDARERLTFHLRRFYAKHGTKGYALKCDLKNYFGSTSHELAKKTIRKYVDDDWVLYHLDKIVDSYSDAENPGVGLGLGSEITQLIELAILDDLDHYIKEKLKIKYYVRYNDDFILIHEDKEYLKHCLKEIEKYLGVKRLKLNKKKTQIFPLKQGIKFLGFKFKLTKDGKVLMILNKENIKKRKRKLKKYEKLVEQGRMTRQDVDESLTSWKSHAKKGNSYKIIKKMDELYKNLRKE